MPDAFAILGLRRKRAHIAGEIEAVECRLVALRLNLSQVDAVIRLFDATSNPELIPSIRPCGARGLFFHHGEQQRLCLEALREAKAPMRVRAVAEYAMTAKGIPTDDARLREGIAEQTRTALARLERRGTVRKVLVSPEVWWELTQK